MISGKSVQSIDERKNDIEKVRNPLWVWHSMKKVKKQEFDEIKLIRNFFVEFV